MNAPESGRQSIWSVASGWLPAYFALFDALGLTGTAFVIVRNVLWVAHPSIDDMIWAIIVGIVVVGAASATISILIVETGKNAMIVGTYLEEMIKKRRARQMAEAVERGVAQNDAKWRAWNDRRLAAEAKGEPFDEPPPGLDG